MRHSPARRARVAAGEARESACNDCFRVRNPDGTVPGLAPGTAVRSVAAEDFRLTRDRGVSFGRRKEVASVPVACRRNPDERPTEENGVVNARRPANVAQGVLVGTPTHNPRQRGSRPRGRCPKPCKSVRSVVAWRTTRLAVGRGEGYSDRGRRAMWMDDGVIGQARESGTQGAKTPPPDLCHPAPITLPPNTLLPITRHPRCSRALVARVVSAAAMASSRSGLTA
jgi:hypothetical protein